MSKCQRHVIAGDCAAHSWGRFTGGCVNERQTAPPETGPLTRGPVSNVMISAHHPHHAPKHATMLNIICLMSPDILGVNEKFARNSLILLYIFEHTKKRSSRHAPPDFAMSHQIRANSPAARCRSETRFGAHTASRAQGKPRLSTRDSGKRGGWFCAQRAVHLAGLKRGILPRAPCPFREAGTGWEEARPDRQAAPEA